MKFKSGLVLGIVAAMTMQMAAFAETIGYVDFQKVLSNYEQAQLVMSDIKVKEAELRKMQAEFVKKIEESRKDQPKNPVGASQLEKDLNDQLNAKVREYRDWAETKQKEIDATLETAVKGAAQASKVNVVLTRQAIFEGGVDLTNDVLARLNK